MIDFHRDAPFWHETTILQRLTDCRCMLLFHGVITEAENAKIKQRIENELAKQKQKETR